MSESRIKDGNYYVVQSFMVKELGLKGLEKDVYAIIYGFSQAENQKFDGSLQYLADWTSSTKQGVMKVLKSLQEKGLINKEEEFKNSVKFVKYYTTEFNGGIKHSLTGGIKQSLPNNIDNDNIDYKYIVDFLNDKAKTNYRYQTSKTQSLIRARIKEGFTLNDFEKVITNKCSEWLGTNFETYLRPETLFGTKFESYLNSKKVVNKKVQSRTYTEQELNSRYTNLDDIDL